MREQGQQGCITSGREQGQEQEGVLGQQGCWPIGKLGAHRRGEVRVQEKAAGPDLGPVEGESGTVNRRGTVPGGKICHLQDAGAITSLMFLGEDSGPPWREGLLLAKVPCWDWRSPKFAAQVGARCILGIRGWEVQVVRGPQDWHSPASVASLVVSAHRAPRTLPVRTETQVLHNPFAPQL